jgi:cation transport ATPase
MKWPIKEKHLVRIRAVTLGLIAGGVLNPAVAELVDALCHVAVVARALFDL